MEQPLLHLSSASFNEWTPEAGMPTSTGNMTTGTLSGPERAFRTRYSRPEASLMASMPSPPASNGISPRSPSPIHRNTLCATVEDCPDEGETVIEAYRPPPTPPAVQPASAAPTVLAMSGNTKLPINSGAGPRPVLDARTSQYTPQYFQPDTEPRAVGNPELDERLGALEGSSAATAGLPKSSPLSAINNGPGDRPNEGSAAPQLPESWNPNHAGSHPIAPLPNYGYPQAAGQGYGAPWMACNHIPMFDGSATHASPSIFFPGYGAEKPPMSGYQLLAAKLVGGLGGPPVAPLYRRFEALHHRLLLYMQADIVELENELFSLDMRDTVERSYGFIPASRRQERWANGGMAQQKTDVLGHIGYKLSQYCESKPFDPGRYLKKLF